MAVGLLASVAVLAVEAEHIGAAVFVLAAAIGRIEAAEAETAAAGVASGPEGIRLALEVDRRSSSLELG